MFISLEFSRVSFRLKPVVLFQFVKEKTVEVIKKVFERGFFMSYNKIIRSFSVLFAYNERLLFF